MHPHHPELLFPAGLPTYFGNLPTTPAGIYLSFEHMRRLLQTDAASEAYEAVIERIYQTCIALSVLLGKPVGTNSLTFKLGAVQDHRRQIFLSVQGHDPVFRNAAILVQLDYASGELYRPIQVTITSHDER